MFDLLDANVNVRTVVSRTCTSDDFRIWRSSTTSVKITGEKVAEAKVIGCQDRTPEWLGDITDDGRGNGVERRIT